MKKKFEQLSNKPSYMKHNGGLLFRSITKKKFEFKTKIKKTHLNKAGITHGGYICTIIDAGAGTACHRASGNKPCVTISLDIKFILLVRLLGVEPRTSWSVAKRSIQLSYRRYFFNY